VTCRKVSAPPIALSYRMLAFDMLVSPNVTSDADVGTPEGWKPSCILHMQCRIHAHLHM
jgi:hypothetical protein